MKTTSLIASVILTISVTCALAQSKITEDLQKKYSARPFFFYNNTLRMINQKDDKDFDELIKNIEKMKVLLIKKPSTFSSADYKKIVSDYAGDTFEEGMTSRFEGKSLDIFFKFSKERKVKGVLVLVNDKEMLYVLDVVGSIAMDKIGSLYKQLESSKEIQEVLNNFAGEQKNKEKEKEKEAESKKDDN